MLWFLFGLFLAGVTVCIAVLYQAYGAVPAKELKRRARRGDELAALLYRPVAYGLDARIILAATGLISLYFAFVVLVEAVSEWLAVPVLLGVGFLGYVIVRSRGGSAPASVWVAAKVSPPLTWLAERLHPLLDLVGRGLRKIFPIRLHSGLYEKEDLAKLLEQQKGQPDNRIEPGEIDLLLHALSFGDKHVSDVLVPKRVVSSVRAEDTVGPVLMAELHTTGHSRFPVFEGKKQQDTVVGILYLRDIIGMTKTVPVREAMHAEVSYIHEDFTLYQALQAFIKTKQHLFIVVNAFEEYVGIITIEDVLERVIGKLIVDEFDKYDDLRAVAAAAARKEHAENHKNGVGAEPTPETKEMVQ